MMDKNDFGIYYLNLYKHGDKPYWTMHNDRHTARQDALAASFKGVDALYVAIPIDADSIDKYNEKEPFTEDIRNPTHFRDY